MKDVRAAAVVAAAALFVVSGCSDEPLKPAPQRSASQISSYVAMGDSFSSGPGIAPEAEDSGPCLRSAKNYPSVLAGKLGMKTFKDVTCAGASTLHVLNAVPASATVLVPAQEDALSRGTDLVTIGIGLNNEQLVTRLLAACVTSPTQKSRDCSNYVDQVMPGSLAKIRSAVVNALRSIRRRAPQATVIVVGYLPLVAETGACQPDLLTRDNEQLLFDAEQEVDTALSGVAAEAGAEFVSMRRAAQGHGMCDGTEAWVNGATAPAGDGVVAHPRAVGMVAVADAIDAYLRSASRRG